MWALSVVCLPALVFVYMAFRHRQSHSDEQDSVDRAIVIHKERLNALADQHQAGDLKDDEYASFKLEEEKALLEESARSERTEQSMHPLPWSSVLGVSVLITVLAFYTYTKIGAYEAVQVTEKFTALSQMESFDPAQVSDAIQSYQALLADNVDDIDGWFRLARLQLDLEDYASAVASFRHVLKQVRLVEHQAEDEASILSYIGQALTAKGDLADALIAYEESLGLSQNNAALGMAGRLSFELADYQKAIQYWRELQLRNPEANPEALNDFINRAKTALAEQGIDYDAQAATQIVVTINLPAAWQGLEQNSALFVYARPIGQRMPLAAKRVRVDAQTMKIMLTDADAMGPAGGLSSQTQVEVTARVSLSGIANSQPGDWQGNVVELDLSQGNLEATINIQLP